ncbi:hypothetical protein A9X01_14690 [Mycobacterium asiaticum]|uniref:Uncharacterized protein n=1 Tax=Mycobacterium asiaticum TaxID=1790 RepID=A0A1A3CNZ2_MYCAS|nr:hypothetical protein A9X01_14690 [Mycobacterium asiaticum]
MLLVIAIVEAVWLAFVKLFGLSAQLAIPIASAWVVGAISIYAGVHKDDLRAMKLTRRVLAIVFISAIGMVFASISVILFVPRVGTAASKASPAAKLEIPADQFNLEGRWHSPTWSRQIRITEPAAVVELLIEYKNRGQAVHTNVTFQMELPKGVRPLRGAVHFGVDSHPDGVRASDALWEKGMNIGAYGPGGGTYVTAVIQFEPDIELPCGDAVVPLRATGYSSELPSDKTWTSNQLLITYVKTCAPG